VTLESIAIINPYLPHICILHNNLTPQDWRYGTCLYTSHAALARVHWVNIR